MHIDMRTHNPALASPLLPGDKPISTAARVAALDLLLDELGTVMTPGEADMTIDYAAARLERGEVDGAIATLTSACGGYIVALRLIAVLETHDPAAIVDRINARYGTSHTIADLAVIDGVWTIDGMDPDQWAEALYGDGEALSTIEAMKG